MMWASVEDCLWPHFPYELLVAHAVLLVFISIKMRPL